MLGPAVQLGVREIRSTPPGEAILAKGRCFGCFPGQFSVFLGVISAQVRQKVLGATVRFGAKFGVKRRESERFTPNLPPPFLAWRWKSVLPLLAKLSRQKAVVSAVFAVNFVVFRA